MNSLFPSMKFKVSESVFDAKSMLDETNFYHQRQGAPSMLTNRLTYILGKTTGKYPLATMTMGGVGFNNKNSYKEIDDVQFSYPVMGAMDKASEVAYTEYDGSSNIGKGNAPFYLYFRDNWIKRYYVIQSGSGVQAYVLGDPEVMPTGYFRYKVQLEPAGPTETCPLSQVQAGAMWVELYPAVAESESRGTESKMVMPGSFKNQMSFLRTGWSWAGNAANKMMKIDVEMDGKTSNVWMDYAMWQYEQRWLEDQEHFFWYSKYNRRADGTISLKDPNTGKAIPLGSGLLEQILNKDTYSELTYDILASKIGDALYGIADAQNMTITLMGGTGARRDIDRVIKEKGGQILNSFDGVADKFVTGTGSNLALGGFFSSFYHIDGYVIKFKYNPIFDHGRIAMASPKHPKTGLPLESHRLVFIDDADVDGQPNIIHVAQKGRAFVDAVIKGISPIPKSLEILLGNTGGKAASSDIDKASYTRMKSAGIQLLRGNRCLDLQCVAGL